MNFIILILIILVASGLALMLGNKMAMGKKILASASTIGLFYALGTTVYWFLNFLIGGVIMYFYATSKDIEDALLKIIVLTTTVGLLGWWRHSQKEGFFVTPLRVVSNSLTAKQCQDACEGSLGCKYAQVPLASSATGGRYKCWNSYGFNQRQWGGEKQGGDTWRNKKWRPPITSSGSYSGAIQTTGSRPDYRLVKYNNLGTSGMIPQEVYLHVDMRDQGWGNPTWGVYVEGYDKNGKSVFSKVLKAPRTSRQQSYPIYVNRPYTARQCNRRRRCYGWWIFRRCYNYTQCQNVRRYRRVVSRYGSKTVQGPVSHQVKTWTLSNNEQKEIRSVRCFVKTRGQGHSLRAQAIRFSVKGWPVGGGTTSINVGPSRTNNKVVTLPQDDMRVNPTAINPQASWWRDRFRVTVRGNKMTVTRLDSNSGWGQNLVLRGTFA